MTKVSLKYYLGEAGFSVIIVPFLLHALMLMYDFCTYRMQIIKVQCLVKIVITN